ncbi:MAG: T9SS type A sorting domain-containing protein [Draconibacterium sp.]|nr:T9SS type A sorting domain-containing protein [Draconibacterium sp.]
MIRINLKLSMLLVATFSVISVSAQVRSDVCTPKGTTVIAYITPENSDYWRAYYDSVYALNYPNAIQIPTYDGYSSTRRFNCHGYAWHIADGGSARWIGIGGDNDPEYTYWQDGSYTEATRTYPGKVNWSSGDHSAITTEHRDTLISKWNEYPLMKHAWDDSPYGTSSLKYYKLNFSISGSDLVCNSNTTYSLSPTPGGTTNWTKSSNLSFVGGSSGTSVTVKTVSSTTSGDGGLHANFTSGCGTSFVVDKTVWAGVPNTPTDITNSYNYPENTLALDEQNQLIAVPQNALNVTNFEWDYGGWYHFEVGYQDFVSYVSVPSYFVYKDVKLRAQNTCGASDWHTERFYPYGGYFMMFSPNPATDETTLSIEAATEENFDEKAGWEMEVYSETQLLKEKKTQLKGRSTIINTAGWKEGVYMVRVKYNNEVLQGKLVVKK